MLRSRDGKDPDLGSFNERSLVFLIVQKTQITFNLTFPIYAQGQQDQEAQQQLNNFAAAASLSLDLSEEDDDSLASLQSLFDLRMGLG